MKLFKTAVLVAGVAILSTALSPVAKADEWNKKTIIKFSGPVEIPGVHMEGFGILPAGTYVFKIVDSQSNRHIVQIFSEDETKVYATILSIPNFRLKATDKTVITFAERPAGQPEAIRAWFYPGRNWGEEFVYSKAQATSLARANSNTVLFSSEEMSTTVTDAAKLNDTATMDRFRRSTVSAVQPTGEEVELSQAVTPAPEEVAVAAVEAPVAEPAPFQAASPQATSPQTSVPEPSNSQVASSTATQDRLPETASNLPFLGLLGLISLAGASFVRSREKRIL